MNNTELNFSWQGQIDFAEALVLQNEAIHLEKNIIFGLEHPEVITLGKRGNQAKDVMLTGLDSNIVSVDRGGQATLHSPGQLVVYPVISLKAFGLSVRSYVELLESATINVLAALNITAHRGAQAGVFTHQGKIAFVGVRIKNGMTSHGIAINFCNDLKLFEKIRPCGVCEAQFDQVSNYPGASQMNLQNFFNLWSESFQNHLKPTSKTGTSTFNLNQNSSLGVVGSAPP